MSYKCQIFERTGFSAANMPYNFNVIWDLSTSGDISDTYPIKRHYVGELKIRQQRHLPSVRIKASWSDVNNCDYMVLYKGSIPTDADDATGLWCYFVTNPIMVADDTAELTLLYDPITSMGGIPKLKIVSGITTRSTYALIDVNAKDLPTDPYLAPLKPMGLDSAWLNIGGNGENHYLASTLDLHEMGAAGYNAAYVAGNGLDKVTIPTPTSAGSSEYIKYGLAGRQIEVKGTAVFKYDNVGVRNGIARARGLGVETAITASWQIPSNFVASENYDANTGLVSSITGVESSIDSTLNRQKINIADVFDNQSVTDATLKQKIVDILNYSEYMSFTLTTASGEAITIDPKDILTYNGNGTFEIEYKADVRPDGKPYYRVKFLNTTAANTGGNWWRNVISGLPWKQIPLVFTQASGSILNTAKFEASRTIAQTGLENAVRSADTSNIVARNQRDFDIYSQNKRYNLQNNLNMMNTMGNTLGGIVNGASQGGIYGAVVGGVTGAYGGITNQYMAQLGKDLAIDAANVSYDLTKYANQQGLANTLNSYMVQKASDILNYRIANRVVIPTVMFPFNTETLRDFYGNGLLVTRPTYQPTDAKRIARIIKAFGVEYTKESAKHDFEPQNGMDYCYVDAQIQIAGKPKWVCDDVNAQLSGGVRIWKKQPYRIEL